MPRSYRLANPICQNMQSYLTQRVPDCARDLLELLHVELVDHHINKGISAWTQRGSTASTAKAKRVASFGRRRRVS